MEETKLLSNLFKLLQKATAKQLRIIYMVAYEIIKQA